jgi:hypothetical protein
VALLVGAFVIRHSSFVIRHSSFVIRHSSFVIRHSSFVIRHSAAACNFPANPGLNVGSEPSTIQPPFLPSMKPRPTFLGFLLLASASLALAEPRPPEPPPLEHPKPPPAQISSSEGMPPLPYPAVFQKRQERKNPPQPPVLLTKISSKDAEDWTRTPNDLKGLLQWMSQEMKVNFSSNIKSLNDISTDPQRNPILYRSGYKPFKLSHAEVVRLREYLLNGGSIVFNSLVGHPDAYQSACQAAKEILPDSTLYRLRMDHPVFHSFNEIDKVGFRPRMQKDGVAPDPYPWLEGMDLDNRTAIFISRWDIALGWESNQHESWGYVDGDARKIGANIVSYVTAMRDAGRSVGKSVELVNADKNTAGKFRVGQIRHEGPWKTRVAAFPMLLNQFHSATGTPVSFELRDVSLTDASIFEMPFLYMTGTTDFIFTEQEIEALRRFLNNGGVLWVEAGEGRQSFDAAFRQQIAKVLPGKPLTALPQGHEIFTRPQDATVVKARPALAIRKDNQIEQSPELFGIELNGTLSVIYTPNDLSAGWERALAPYAVGYEAQGATALGVNVLYYAVTH